MIIRHAKTSDLDDIYELAKKGGTGLTSLPANKDILKARLERVEKTVLGQQSKDQQGYLFALEDTITKKVVGLSGLEVAVGLNEPWYNFHIGKQVHASNALKVHKTFPTLFLSNDHTGCSELCTLFLDADYRHGKNGKFLSKIRFLFISAFQTIFTQKLVAEMRGFSTDQGDSPFWNALGQHFFNTQFSNADYLSGTGSKSFIAELMPRHPIYIDLLPQDAQDVIGKTHPHTAPAAKMLQAEGLRFQGYVDIFDAGPTLQAEVQDLRAVQNSQHVQIALLDTAENELLQPNYYLLANDNHDQYRGILALTEIQNGQIYLTLSEIHALGLKIGQDVRVLALEP